MNNLIITRSSYVRVAGYSSASYIGLQLMDMQRASLEKIRTNEILGHVFNHEFIRLWGHPCVYERSEVEDRGTILQRL